MSHCPFPISSSRFIRLKIHRLRLHKDLFDTHTSYFLLIIHLCLSFSVISNRHKLCLFLLCLCLSSVTDGTGSEARSLPDFGTSSTAHPFPAAIQQTHLSYYTTPAHRLNNTHHDERG